MSEVFAEDMNYWCTGKSSPDVWIARTRDVIEGLGGTVEAEAFGSDRTTGRAAFVIQFRVATGQEYRITWPVLKSRTGKEQAARVQAATFVYHDCKAKAVSAAVLGVEAVFFQHLLLPDGRTAGQLAAPELLEMIPHDMAPRLGHEES